MLKVQFVNCR